MQTRVGGIIAPKVGIMTAMIVIAIAPTGDNMNYEKGI
jgi:hypothetical protein